MKRILITGATGFTGVNACGYFAEIGYEVYGMVHKKIPKDGKANYVSCDLMNSEEVEEALKNIQPHYVLHLAGQNHSGRSWEEPISTFMANVNGTLNLLEAVRHYSPNADIIVVGSVIDFNPCSLSKPNHPYGLSKYVQTLLSTSWSSLYDLNIKIARPSNLIGPGPSNGICSLLARKIAMNEKKYTSEGFHFHNILDQRDFLDVRDAIRAYHSIFKYGQNVKSYNIASGKDRTILEVVRAFKFLSVADLEITTDFFQRQEPMYVDIKEIKLLGWEPKYTFQESIKETLNFHRGEVF
ncbi:GDP-4-dehydro-6-deoxy-D-mannose reductase [Bacillus pakistanensis]|uniref:GDP-4-dehydro-6-deoxy-D-mannose reductase n=1 Tax=Rossellomorea pakistanensis TaxID=992288 RepID=A0ABS2NGE2_9BACI|nr:NAD-dependent epimerase/dehydratase family protein [Bacillus pakistanensis]MBM7586935.1 GDP-4-dehydro-6-deoxy-D-mannose reductase [Bacillus pakistanensis]